MRPSLKNAKKAISALQNFIQRIEQKAPPLPDREEGSSPYGITLMLQQSAPDFLFYPEALDHLLASTLKVETYRGKGTHIFKSGLLKVLQSIPICAEFGDAAQISEEDKKKAFQKIAHFAFAKALGDGKRVRSRSVIKLRQGV